MGCGTSKPDVGAAAAKARLPANRHCMLSPVILYMQVTPLCLVVINSCPPARTLPRLTHGVLAVVHLSAICASI